MGLQARCDNREERAGHHVPGQTDDAKELPDIGERYTNYMKTSNEGLVDARMLESIALKETERQHGMVAVDMAAITLLEQVGQIFVNGCFTRLGPVNDSLARMERLHGWLATAAGSRATAAPICSGPAPGAVSHQTAHLTDASGKNSVCGESGSAMKP
jgi:hypothetical protein